MALYTMAGPDIDALMGFDGVPVYNSEDPTEWNDYLKKAGKARNGAIFSAINWASRTALAPDLKQRDEAWVTLNKWLKYVGLLLALCADPRGRGKGEQLWKKVNRKHATKVSLGRLRAAVLDNEEMTQIFAELIPKWEQRSYDDEIGKEEFLSFFAEADPENHKEVTVARGIAGLPIEVIDAHENMLRGQEIHWPAPSSCAFDQHVSESYIKGEGANTLKASGGGSILFLISKASVGLPLQAISQYPKEAELLVPPLTTMEITDSRTSHELGFPIVEMRLQYSSTLGATSLAAFCERGKKDSDVATQDMARLMLNTKDERYPAGTPVEARVVLQNGDEEWRPANVIRAVAEGYLVDYRADSGKRYTAIVDREAVKLLPTTNDFKEELAAQTQFAKNLFREKTRIIQPEHLDGATIVNQVIEKVEKGSNAEKIGLMEGTKIKRLGRIDIAPRDTTEVIQKKLREARVKRRASRQSCMSGSTPSQQNSPTQENSPGGRRLSPMNSPRAFALERKSSMMSSADSDGVELEIAVPKQAERIAQLEASLLLLQKRMKVIEFKDEDAAGGVGPHPLTNGVRFVGNTVVEVDADCEAADMGVKIGCRLEAVNGEAVPGDVEPDVLWTLLGGDAADAKTPDVILTMPDSASHKDTVDAYLTLCVQSSTLLAGGAGSPEGFGFTMGGTVVVGVAPGSPADLAGVPVGGILCGLGDKDFVDDGEMADQFRKTTAGECYELRFQYRECDHEAAMVRALMKEAAALQQQEISVELSSAHPAAVSKLPKVAPGPSVSPDADALALPAAEDGFDAPAPPREGFGAALRGTTVVSVTKGSAAGLAGLTKGTRLHAVNGTKVATEQEANAALRAAMASGCVVVNAVVPVERPDVDVDYVDGLQHEHALKVKQFTRDLERTEEEKRLLAAELEAEQARASEAMNRYRESAATAGKDILTLEGDLKQKAADLEEARAAMENVRRNLEAVSAAFSHLGSQHDADEAALKDRDAQYNSLKESAAGREASLKDASRRLTGDLEALSKRLRDESAEARRVVEAKDRELEDLRREQEDAGAALNRQLKEAKDALREQVRHIKEAVGADDSLVELLGEDFASAEPAEPEGAGNPDAESRDLLASIATLRKSQQKLTEGLRRSLEAKEAELADTKAALESTSADLAASEERLACLEKEQREARAALQGQLAEAKRALREQVVELRQVFGEEKSTALDALREMGVDDLEAELADGEGLNGFEAESKSLLAAIAKLRASQQQLVDGLRLSLTEEREKRCALEAENAELKEAIARMRDEEAAAKEALRGQIREAKQALRTQLRGIRAAVGDDSSPLLEGLELDSDADELEGEPVENGSFGVEARDLMSAVQKLRMSQARLTEGLRRQLADEAAKRAALEGSDQRATDLEAELAVMTKEHAAAKDALREHIAAARKMLEEQLEGLQGAFGAERGELRAAIDKEHAQRNSEKAQLLAALEATDAKRKGEQASLLEDSKRLFAGMTAAMEEERRQHRACQKIMAELRAELDAIAAQEEAAKEALRAQIREARAALREQVNDLREVYGVDAAELIADLDASGVDLAQLAGDGDGSFGHDPDAHNLLTAIKKLRGSQQTLLKGLRRSLEEEQGRRAALSQKVTRRDRDIAGLETQLDGARGKIDALRADLARCHEDLEKALREQVRLSTLEAMWEEIKRIHHQLDALDTVSHDLFDKQTPRCVADMKREIRSVRTRVRHVSGERGRSASPQGRDRSRSNTPRGTSPPPRVPARGAPSLRGRSCSNTPRSSPFRPRPSASHSPTPNADVKAVYNRLHRDAERRRSGSRGRPPAMRSSSPPEAALPPREEGVHGVFGKWGISASGELYVDGGVAGYEGVRVVTVAPPAHPLVRANDVVTHVDGLPVGSTEAFKEALQAIAPGGWGEFTLRRWCDGVITTACVRVRSMLSGVPPGQPAGRTIVAMGKTGAVLDVQHDVTARHRQNKRTGEGGPLCDPLRMFTERSGSPIRNRDLPIRTDTDFSPHRAHPSPRRAPSPPGSDWDRLQEPAMSPTRQGWARPGARHPTPPRLTRDLKRRTPAVAPRGSDFSGHRGRYATTASSDVWYAPSASGADDDSAQPSSPDASRCATEYSRRDGASAPSTAADVHTPVSALTREGASRGGYASSAPPSETSSSAATDAGGAPLRNVRSPT
eukprot:TRINITY_DN16552_c0_g1_i1.p1 TRINITY_DN16552_c0_g1~~TRINITY_DN16552_c0_g1_i1.p1  ORF type:complete len:2301 (+),score=750.59 TRINITY_DN16552_c0_g1_i1:377-6904(+)